MVNSVSIIFVLSNGKQITRTLVSAMPILDQLPKPQFIGTKVFYLLDGDIIESSDTIKSRELINGDFIDVFIVKK